MNTPLPHLTLTGTPHQQGLTHGRELAGDIAANVAMYRARLRDDAGLTGEQVAERAGLYLDVFTAADPAYRAMMDGIAEGSGLPLIDIAVLNARYEILYSAWSAAGRTDVGECTSFGVTRAASGDGVARIGQNWDWFPGVRCALLRVEEEGRTILGLTEAGIAGVKIGVNDAGVGLCVNGLTSDTDSWERGGLPFHLRTWRALHAPDLAGAIAAVTEGAEAGEVSCSANFMLGDRGGVADVELSPKGARVLRTERVLVHANHFVDPAVLGVTETWRTWPPTTFDRHERLETLLGDGPVALDEIEAKLRDHENGVNALCRHPLPSQPEHLRVHTALGVILDLDAPAVSYTAGPPCESPFTTVAL
ncbi:peptidase C45 [Actinorhabdospora filicis]|uniref:Peptidase C45 n=1 Tax=Actinorhabdospora filicis TaxID=1785913 RepID=A0A9W6WAN8_9ACTN|nr:C45 family peptidase [Actinorhabdospora filicis]GLZ78786.1 peptidase C45 [Actinorhabdospora filicis]